MADEITNSDTLIPYLVASNTVNCEVCIIVLHSIKQCSTGFGRSNALPHGKMLGLLGEMVDTRLPRPLLRLNQDPDEDLIHALLIEEVQVPSDTLVEA
jgi:hypothetical protein